MMFTLLIALRLASSAPGAPPGKPADAVQTQRLMDAIAALPTRRAAWGDAQHRDGLVSTEQWLKAQLQDLGYTPVMDEVAWLGSRRDPEHTWHNLIVEIPGRQTPSEVLIVSAHLDAMPRSPGADDDGTGIAAVLELARVLKDRPMQRTVRLCLFNLEEVGLAGSGQYAGDVGQRIHDGKEKVVGMIALDMLGFFSDEPDSQRSPIPAVGEFKPPTVADFIAIGGILSHRDFSQSLDAAMRAAAPALKTVVVDFLPIAPPDLLRSDHAPFLAIGVPAVIVSDTANFRSPHYHKPTDTIGTIDKERFTTVVRALAGAVYELAGPVAEGAAKTSEQAPAPAGK